MTKSLSHTTSGPAATVRRLQALSAPFRNYYTGPGSCPELVGGDPMV